jgi:hypothetical protein
MLFYMQELEETNADLAGKLEIRNREVARLQEEIVSLGGQVCGIEVNAWVDDSEK